MRIYDNGIYRDATAEEIAEMERQQAEEEERQRTAPPTEEERLSTMEDVILELLGGNA